MHSLWVPHHDDELVELVLVDEVDEALLDGLSSLGSDIHFTYEDSIKPGDCQVESNGHAVVACLERQLDDIQEQLMEALEDARTERTDTE